MIGSQGYDYEHQTSIIKDEITHLQEECTKVLQDYQLKVIGEEDDDTVFKSISIGKPKYTITPIGSVRITCSIRSKEKCYIFGNRPAFIDGSLVAKIFQDGKFLGVADLVLPAKGLNENSVTLKGISMCNADCEKQCQISIMAKNLWKIES